jgi:hypothetical protein
VENDPLTAVIHVPSPYAFSQARAEDAEVVEIASAPSLLKVRSRRADNGGAWLIVTFTKP